jgi:hypothetical protein
MYKGSCLCGSVEITVTGEISDIIHCHCSLCRKASGTAYATNGFVNVLDFEINNGRELLSSFESSPGKFRNFCSKCTSPIYSSNELDKTRIRIRLGILDSDISERPISHNFVTSKANWEDLDAVLPRYENYEPSRA